MSVSSIWTECVFEWAEMERVICLVNRVAMRSEREIESVQCVVVLVVADVVACGECGC